MVAGQRPMKKWPFQRDAGMAGVSGERFFLFAKKELCLHEKERQSRARQGELKRYNSTTDIRQN